MTITVYDTGIKSGTGEFPRPSMASGNPVAMPTISITDTMAWPNSSNDDHANLLGVLTRSHSEPKAQRKGHLRLGSDVQTSGPHLEQSGSGSEAARKIMSKD